MYKRERERERERGRKGRCERELGNRGIGMGDEM